MSRRLRLSWPALLGNVGIIAVLLGRGSSLNQLWVRISSAVGRESGFNESKDERRLAPEEVRNVKRPLRR